ncbi:MAG TPA: hypothetical protein VF807_10825, partial [Ktedonobacterales bacterium]
LREGRWGRVFRVGTVGYGLALPLPLRLLARVSGGRLDPPLSALASALGLMGALLERFAIVEAGKVSAADPRAYQALTAGAPGEARPTPAQQAARGKAQPRFKAGLAARDTAVGEAVRRWARLREPAEG